MILDDTGLYPDNILSVRNPLLRSLQPIYQANFSNFNPEISSTIPQTRLGPGAK